MDAGRLLQQLLIHRIVKCQLENPCTVAQIDKYKIAKVTYFLYKSCGDNFLSYIRSRKLRTVVGSFKPFHRIHIIHLFLSLLVPLFYRI